VLLLEEVVDEVGSDRDQVDEEQCTRQDCDPGSTPPPIFIPREPVHRRISFLANRSLRNALRGKMQ
jgi:hypothetical protein